MKKGRVFLASKTLHFQRYFKKWVGEKLLFSVSLLFSPYLPSKRGYIRSREETTRRGTGSNNCKPGAQLRVILPGTELLKNIANYYFNSKDLKMEPENHQRKAGNIQ